MKSRIYVRIIFKFTFDKHKGSRQRDIDNQDVNEGIMTILKRKRQWNNGHGGRYNSLQGDYLFKSSVINLEWKIFMSCPKL